VCRSARIAEKCRAAARDVEALAKVEWLNIERLRREAPYDRIIVPAWLDRFSTRELALNGYAPRLDFVLLPFERRWFDGPMTAMRRWERQQESRTGEPDRRAGQESRTGEPDSRVPVRHGKGRRRAGRIGTTMARSNRTPTSGDPRRRRQRRGLGGCRQNAGSCGEGPNHSCDHRPATATGKLGHQTVAHVPREEAHARPHASPARLPASGQPPVQNSSYSALRDVAKRH
jgi:hypothetical protein